jgi:hypothetical protein
MHRFMHGFINHADGPAVKRFIVIKIVLNQYVVLI